MVVHLKMAAKAAGKTALRYFLGTCVPSSKQNAAKVRVPRLQFDDYIHMVSMRMFIKYIIIFTSLRFLVEVIFPPIQQYFRENDFVYAHDPKRLCKIGDVILIKMLPEKLTRLITHEVCIVLAMFNCCHCDAVL